MLVLRSAILQNNRIDDFSALHTTSHQKIGRGCPDYGIERLFNDHKPPAP